MQLQSLHNNPQDVIVVDRDILVIPMTHCIRKTSAKQLKLIIKDTQPIVQHSKKRFNGHNEKLSNNTKLFSSCSSQKNTADLPPPEPDP